MSCRTYLIAFDFSAVVDGVLQYDTSYDRNRNYPKSESMTLHTLSDWAKICHHLTTWPLAMRVFWCSESSHGGATAVMSPQPALYVPFTAVSSGYFVDNVCKQCQDFGQRYYMATRLYSPTQFRFLHKMNSTHWNAASVSRVHFGSKFSVVRKMSELKTGHNSSCGCSLSKSVPSDVIQINRW